MFNRETANKQTVVVNNYIGVAPVIEHVEQARSYGVANAVVTVIVALIALTLLSAAGIGILLLLQALVGVSVSSVYVAADLFVWLFSLFDRIALGIGSLVYNYGMSALKWIGVGIAAFTALGLAQEFGPGILERAQDHHVRLVEAKAPKVLIMVGSKEEAQQRLAGLLPEQTGTIIEIEQLKKPEKILVNR